MQPLNYTDILLPTKEKADPTKVKGKKSKIPKY